VDEKKKRRTIFYGARRNESKEIMEGSVCF
jgi:hypothetical protein